MEPNDSQMRARRFDLSRRAFVGGTAVAVAGAILAACGGNPDATKPGGTTAPTTAAPTTAGAATTGAGSAAAPTSALRPATSTPQASAAAATGETPQPGGRLIIADAAGDNPLDPFKTSWHSTAHFLVFTSYVSKAPDLSYVPYTFDSWQLSPDSKEVTFKVRAGLKNSDGTAVDAPSLKYIIDRLVDPQRKSPGASAFGPIKGTTVLDPMTIKFTYDAPYGPLFNGISGSEVSSAAAVQKYGDDFTNHPIGPGPYLVKDQIAGNSIVYDRNPDYAWPPPFYKNRGAAYFDGVTIKIIKEDATTWAALKAGEVHVAPIPATFVKEADTNQDITVIKQLETGIRYLGMNCSKPPFNDPLVRQAVAHAINRDEVLQSALDGYGQVLYTPLAASIAFSDNEGMKKIAYPFDLNMAKDKLKQAGYDVSGPVAMKNGQPLEVQLMVNNTDFFKRAAQVVQAQLKQIGMKINIQIMEGTALTDATTTGNHQMFILNYGSSDPSIMFYFFHSSRIKATNRAWYSTPELDALLEQGQAELNPDKQKEIYTKVQTMVVQAAPWVVLLNPYTFTGVRKEIRGFQVHPQGGYMLHDAWMPKK